MVETQPIDRLTRADEAEAVATLAAAFVDYPLLVALCPDAASRPPVTAAFCRHLVRMSLRCDGVYATRDRAAVVCSWPAGAEWPSLWAAVRAGGLGFLWRMGWWRSRFLLRMERELDVARRQHVPGPHTYVPLLGVRSEARGKGLSRAVLGPVFAAADRAGVPIYLETVPEVNVAIYRRLGFTLRGHRTLRVGLANWELVRDPPPAGGVSAAGG